MILVVVIVAGLTAMNTAWAVFLWRKAARLRTLHSLCDERWYFLCLTHEVLVDQAEMQGKFHRVLMDYESEPTNE